MRFFFIFFLGVTFSMYSQTYYLSSQGNDSRDGKSPSNAWKTLDKLNSKIGSFTSGTIILLRRGDTFYGTLDIRNKNNITISSYGSGEVPIITGARSIGAWVRESGNLWSTSSQNNVYQVFKNKDVLSNGRYPKIKNDFSTVENYVEVSSKSSNTVFFAKELIGLPNLAGANIQIQSNDWVFSSRKIVDFNSSTGRITIDSAPSTAVDVGDHLFIVNHKNLLSKEGEWSYEENSNKLYLYSSNSPQNIVINDIADDAINIANSNNVTIENISFNFFKGKAIYANSCDNLKVDSNSFNYCYDGAIITKNSFGTIITKNNILGSMAYGINVNMWDSANQPSNAIIQYNVIKDVAMLKQATSGDINIPFAIASNGNGNNVSFNTMERIGYCGIRLYGSNGLIEKNYIKDFCLISHDGGGIKTGAPTYNDITADGTVINRNIVVNRELSDKWLVGGIYMDDHTKNITITDNTVVDCYWGVYLHNNKNIILDGTKIYDNSNSQNGILLAEDKRGVKGGMVNNVVKNNEVFVLNSSVTSMKVRNGEWDHYNFATYTNNKYFNPYMTECVAFKINSSNGTNMTLNEWKSLTGQDKNSTTDNLNWIPKNPETRSTIAYNSDLKTKSIQLPNGTWEDLQGNLYSGSINLESFGSAILLSSNKTINPSLNPDAGPDETICRGESVQLTASGGTSYKWSTGQTSRSITVSPNSTTIYSVEVSDGTSKASDDVQVTVTSISASAGPNVTISPGEKVTLTASGGDSYLWQTGSTNPSINVSPPRTRSYSVTVYKNGCEETAEVLVTVDDGSNNTVQPNAGPDVTICRGESVQLTASGGTSYVWSTGQTSRSIMVSPNSTTIYSVEVSDGTSKASDDVQVTVASINASAGPNVSISPGEKVTLTASGGDSYLWQTGTAKESITVSPPNTRTYSVTVYKNGCEETAEVLVTVNDGSNTNIQANAGPDVAICRGESVQLTASGGTSYAWSTGQTSKSITVSPNSTTVYSVEVSDGVSKASDDVQVRVTTINASAGPDVTINPGEKVTLTASGGDSYLWQTGTAKESITVSPPRTRTYSVTVYKNGCEETVEVLVTVAAQAKAEASKYYLPPSSNIGEDSVANIDESILLNEKEVVVYPNPSNGVFFINVTSDSYLYNLYNISGNLLATKEINPQESVKPITLNLSSFASGIYLLQVYDKVQVYSRKIIKN
ncbi:right-handed parallel beta-helix repeat-containing protein [Namhaeicola litoreus]|uniref:Right-handed parallel beta-helix repeat-containing protein n=1 Tax=Namhaeicola litoreus TaxID=1052145 RepID=A0ABW3Y4Q3_9FLAO